MSNCEAYYDLRLLYKSDQFERFDRFLFVVQMLLCSGEDPKNPEETSQQLSLLGNLFFQVDCMNGEFGFSHANATAKSGAGTPPANPIPG